MARTHGTRSCYNAGCRCEACQSAERERKRRQRAATSARSTVARASTTPSTARTSPSKLATTRQTAKPGRDVAPVEPTRVLPVPSGPLVPVTRRGPQVVDGQAVPAVASTPSRRNPLTTGDPLVVVGHAPTFAGRFCDGCRVRGGRPFRPAVARVEARGEAGKWEAFVCDWCLSELRASAPAGTLATSSVT